MDEKKYTTKNLYIGVISRQTSRQPGNFWGLINERYCVLIRETPDRYRAVLTDAIYGVSSENTSNQNVINSKTIMPLTKVFTKFSAKEFMSRSEISNLETNELNELLKKLPKYDEYKKPKENCRI